MTRNKESIPGAFFDAEYAVEDRMNLHLMRLKKDILGGVGGAALIKNTNGAATEDMIPSTKIWEGYQFL
jgi:hypothetical protein